MVHLVPTLATFQRLFAFMLVFPFLDLRMMIRLKRATSSAARLRVFRVLLLMAWGAALAAVACSHRDLLRLWPSPVLPRYWLHAIPWARRLAIAVTSGYFGVGLAPGVLCLVRPAARLKYMRALSRMAYLLPVSSTERMWWAVVSLTAGICEEVVYRGFAFGFLTGHMEGGLHLGMVAAWLLSSLAFGLGHLYQGGWGILSTTVAGLALGLAAMLSGGLVVPMILHALLDLQVLSMYRPTIDSAEDADHLMGTHPGSRDAVAL